MTEPELKTEITATPTLPWMLELASEVAILLARYRVGSQVSPAESPKIEACEDHAREIVDALRSMIAARVNAASAEK